MIIQHHRTAVFMQITVIIAPKKQDFFRFIHVIPNNNIYLFILEEKNCTIFQSLFDFFRFSRSRFLCLSSLLLLLLLILASSSSSSTSFSCKCRFISSVTRVFHRQLFMVPIDFLCFFHYVFLLFIATKKYNQPTLRIKI